MKTFWCFILSLIRAQDFCPATCTSCGRSSRNGIVDRGLYICSSEKEIVDVPYGLPKDKIRDLRLNNNAIEKIYQHDFRGWKNMEILHLEENVINEIEMDSFKSFQTLQTLYLSNNQLVGVADGIFLPMSNLR